MCWRSVQHLRHTLIAEQKTPAYNARQVSYLDQKPKQPIICDAEEEYVQAQATLSEAGAPARLPR
ncbi:MAG: hypothetical protein Kow0063_15910 [Anaerolineae bacterium]